MSTNKIEEVVQKYLDEFDQPQTHTAYEKVLTAALTEIQQETWKRAMESLPLPQKNVADCLTYGDTEFQSNAVIFGWNEYQEVALHALRKAQGLSEKE